MKPPSKPPSAPTFFATPADWQVRRSHILAHLQEVMGPLPGGERRVPLAIRVAAMIDGPSYVRKKLTFASEPGDRVPAWLLIPKGTSPARKPRFETE